MVFTYLPDNSSRVLALQGGDIDIASYIAPTSVQTLEGILDLLVRPTVARATLVFMHLNQHKEPWQDAGVRRALSLAIDRDALVNAVLEGQAIPAAGPFPPSFLTCDGVQGHPFDPGMAATPLNIEEFESEDALIVDQMLEPIIMGHDGVVRTGTVTLRKVEP